MTQYTATNPEMPEVELSVQRLGRSWTTYCHTHNESAPTSKNREVAEARAAHSQNWCDGCDGKMFGR